MSQERLFHYVSHADIPAWEALGWVNTGSLSGNSPCHHGHYSELMEWLGEGEPKYPESKE